MVGRPVGVHGECILARGGGWREGLVGGDDQATGELITRPLARGGPKGREIGDTGAALEHDVGTKSRRDGHVCVLAGQVGLLLMDFSFESRLTLH